MKLLLILSAVILLASKTFEAEEEEDRSSYLEQLEAKNERNQRELQELIQQQKEEIDKATMLEHKIKSLEHDMNNKDIAVPQSENYEEEIEHNEEKNDGDLDLNQLLNALMPQMLDESLKLLGEPPTHTEASTEVEHELESPEDHQIMSTHHGFMDPASIFFPQLVKPEPNGLHEIVIKGKDPNHPMLEKLIFGKLPNYGKMGRENYLINDLMQNIV